jgi:hypothetical protein
VVANFMRDGVKHTQATRVPCPRLGEVWLELRLTCAALLGRRFKLRRLDDFPFVAMSTHILSLRRVPRLPNNIASATIAGYVS